MKVMFVCSGNSCRSPMAELYFNSLCEKENRDDIVAVSCGIYAYDGAKISNCAKAVMDELQINSNTFISHRFENSLANEVDLIIAMTNGHAQAITQISPSSKGKTKLLMDFSSDLKHNCCDVPDPFGGSVDDYREIFNFMKTALDNLYNQLKG